MGKVLVTIGSDIVVRSKSLRKVHKLLGELLAEKSDFTGSIELHFKAGEYKRRIVHDHGQ